MNRYRIIVALALIYMIFAVLLNSVGTVILQSIASFHVGDIAASALERYKDLTIAVVSFVVASFLPMLGYRRSMMVSLALVAAACATMALFPTFDTTKLLFLCVGIGFAMAKVAVYSTIGLVTADRTAHSRLTSSIEGMFMVGMLSGQWLFAAYVDPQHPGNLAWTHVYWLLAALCVLVIALLATSQLDESAAHAHHANDSMGDALMEMARLFVRPLVYVFLISAFLYVLIEQSFTTWLPTFNNDVLKLPNALSIQFASILAGSLALGRLLAGYVLKRVPWHLLLYVCVLATATLVLLVLPMARHVTHQVDVTWFSAPAAAWLVPMIGLFLAPIYPVINSIVLSSLPKPMHAAMTGLIVAFSALGGTLGSLITAIVFHHYDGIHAFYFALLPMGLLLASLYFFRRQTVRAGTDAQPTIKLAGK